MRSQSVRLHRTVLPHPSNAFPDRNTIPVDQFHRFPPPPPAQSRFCQPFPSAPRLPLPPVVITSIHFTLKAAGAVLVCPKRAPRESHFRYGLPLVRYQPPLPLPTNPLSVSLSIGQRVPTLSPFDPFPNLHDYRPVRLPNTDSSDARAPASLDAPADEKIFLSRHRPLVFHPFRSHAKILMTPRTRTQRYPSRDH